MAIRVPLLVLLTALVLAAPAVAAPRLAPADRDAIRSVLTRYVPAALERKDIRLAWELSGPQIRGTTTLKEWLAGGIPVYPFAARGDPIDHWETTYVQPGDVGLDLFVQPRKGTKEPAVAFRIEMTKIGGAWKVNAFYPEALFGVDNGKVFSPQDATPNGATAAQAKQRVSGSWLLLPVGLAGGLVLVGGAAWLVLARRRNSVYRAYRERVSQ